MHELLFPQTSRAVILHTASTTQSTKLIGNMYLNLLVDGTDLAWEWWFSYHVHVTETECHYRGGGSTIALVRQNVVEVFILIPLCCSWTDWYKWNRLWNGLWNLHPYSSVWLFATNLLI